MKTEFLNDWQMLAVIESVKQNVTLDQRSKETLLVLLEKASHVRVTYK